MSDKKPSLFKFLWKNIPESSFPLLFLLLIGSSAGGWPGMIVATLTFIACASLIFGRKALFGLENFKLQTKEGKLILEADTKKGLLDKVGYHNPYKRVTVDKVLKDLSDENLGCEKDFEKLVRQEYVELRLKRSAKEFENKLDDLKQIPGANIKRATKLFNVETENAKIALEAVEKSKNDLKALISERTLAALKSNESLFPESDKSKMNASYINEAVKTKFAL